MNFPPLDQLPDKTAPQGRTDCSIDLSVVFGKNVRFYFFRDRDYIRKNQITAVKAIVVYANQMVFFRSPS